MVASGPSDAQNDTAALLAILNGLDFKVGPQRPLLYAEPTGRPLYWQSGQDRAMRVLHECATPPVSHILLTSLCARAVSQTGGILHEELDWRGLSEKKRRGQPLERHNV